MGSFPPGVAIASTNIDFKTSKKELTAENTHVAEAIKISNGKAEKLPVMQYEQELKESNNKMATIGEYRKQNQSTSNQTNLSALCTDGICGRERWTEHYQKEKSWFYFTEPERVSTIVNCSDYLNGCTMSKLRSIKKTETWDAGGGLDLGKVKLNAGHKWSTELAMANTYSFNLPAGKRGYITFSHKRFYTAGWLKSYLNGQFMQQNWVSGSTPVALPSGELDGIFALRLEN